jgi:hypothetical protein
MRSRCAGALLALVFLSACTSSGADSVPWDGYPEGLQQRIDAAEAQHNCDALNKWWDTAHADGMVWLASTPRENDDALEHYILEAIVRAKCV